MKSKRIISIYILLTLAALWMMGFVYFSATVFNYTKQKLEVSDKNAGIAVLTGGRHRISKGLELLELGKGKRLLISGVKKGVRLDEIAARENIHIYDDMPIDLGYEATTTVGNAKEIKTWADKYDFKAIYAVTSFYHIPRSRLELANVMPEKDIRFVAVNSEYISPKWWKNFGSFKFLAAEYCKFLTVWGQYLGGLMAKESKDE